MSNGAPLDRLPRQAAGEDKNFCIPQWQNKNEGVFLPSEIRLERLLQILSEEERVARLIEWEKKLRREKRQPISLSVPRLRFEPGERLPPYPAAVVRARPDETPGGMWDRGLEMFCPHLFERQGLNARWITREVLHLSPQDLPESISDDSIQSIELAVLRDLLDDPNQAEDGAVFLTEERKDECPVQAYAFVCAAWPRFDEPELPRQDEIRKRCGVKITALSRAFKNLAGYGLGDVRFYILPDLQGPNTLIVMAVKDDPQLNVK